MSETTNIFTQLSPLILILVVFYFLLIRPQRKKDRIAREMRDQLTVGDVITTVGGIVGIVVSVKEDSVVIETASERNKIRVKRWAIHTNETVHD